MPVKKPAAKKKSHAAVKKSAAVKKPFKKSAAVKKPAAVKKHDLDAEPDPDIDVQHKTTEKSELQKTLDKMSAASKASTVDLGPPTKEAEIEEEERARAQAFDSLSEDTKERDRLYKEFQRKILSKTDPVGGPIAEEYDRIVKSSARGRMTKLFKLWYSTEGNFKRMAIKLKMSMEENTFDEELEGWMTEAQWADLYKSKELAAELVKRKRAQGLFRRHLEMPDKEEATLFWGLRELRRMKQMASKTSMGIKGNVEPGEQGATTIVKATLDRLEKTEPPPGAPAGMGDENNEEKKEKKDKEKKDKEKKDKEKKDKEKTHKGKDKDKDKDKTKKDKDKKVHTTQDVAKAWQEALMTVINKAQEYGMRLKTVKLQTALTETLRTQAAAAEEIWTKLELLRDTDAGDEAFEEAINKANDMLEPFKKHVEQAAGVLGLKQLAKKTRTAKSREAEEECT